MSAKHFFGFGRINRANHQPAIQAKSTFASEIQVSHLEPPKLLSLVFRIQDKIAEIASTAMSTDYPIRMTAKAALLLVGRIGVHRLNQNPNQFMMKSAQATAPDASRKLPARIPA